MNKPDENAIRDWLAVNIDRLPNLVTNAGQMKSNLEAVEEAFQSQHDHGPSAVLLLRRIIARRMHAALDCLTGQIDLIGTEVPLISTPGVVGRKPSADLLAQNAEFGCLLLVEVKRAVGSEREAVTEMAAYSSGLQGRYLGLAPLDHVWVPIAVDWRQTVSAAFANETVWARRAVLPLKASIESTGSKVDDVSLELLDLTSELDEAAALSQFAWDCYDCTHVALAAEPGDPRSLIGFIGSTAARLGLSGFCIFTKSNLCSEAFPYPYGVVIAAHNPFRGALKQRQLMTVRDEPSHGDIGMRKFVKKRLWDGFDINLVTNAEAWQDLSWDGPDVPDDVANDAELEIDAARSLELLAFASQNRHRSLISELQIRLKLMVDSELSAPSLKGLMDDGGFHLQNAFEQIGTFGLFQEAFEDRVLWECSHATQHGDGPVMGGIGTDAFAAMARWEVLIQFLELMNFEHDCQVECEGDDELP